MISDAIKSGFNRVSNQKYLSKMGRGLAGVGLAVALSIPGGTAQAHHTAEIDTANSRTAYSHYVSQLQKRFNGAASDVDIALVDRDWFEVNYAVNSRPGASDDEKTILQSRLLAEFVERQTGRQLSYNNMTHMGEGVLIGGGRAYLNPYSENNAGLRGLCVVFGQHSGKSGPDQVQTMLGLYPGIHGPAVGNARIRQGLPVDIMNKFTDYHEIGHCMDRWYMTESSERQDYIDDAKLFVKNRHKAEMYAEIFALLEMARDGQADIIDIANRRANMRLVNAALSGPLVAARPAQGDPMANGPYMYMIHEGIWAARDEIARRGPAGMRALSTDQTRALAHQLTEDNALDQDGAAHAVMFMLAQKFDLSIWEKLRHEKDLEYIEERYQIALKLKGQIRTAVREMFDLDHIDPRVDALDLVTYNWGGYRGQEVSDDTKRRAADELAAQMRRYAGGTRGGPQRMILAYSLLKNNLRDDLRSADEAVRDEAALKLSVAGRALLMNMRMMNGLLATAEEAPAAPEKDKDLLAAAVDRPRKIDATPKAFI